MKKKLFVLVFVLAIVMIWCEDVVKEITTTISGKVTNEWEPVSCAYVILLDAGDSVQTYSLIFAIGLVFILLTIQVIHLGLDFHFEIGKRNSVENALDTTLQTTGERHHN
ncbi:MAG: hypothetical protein DRH57_05240 [Candidatus Cloacimonadota bacterium]|nr:MAG: hypothetical protein DRH57_05240 [Candidatus Cloacimonadota bacterium]